MENAIYEICLSFIAVSATIYLFSCLGNEMEDDPDTPIGTFTHWVAWNIPANVSFIPEGIPKDKTISSLGNARQGKNGYLTIGYRGPKPPRGIGTHTYRFKVYVLDTELVLASSAGKKQLLRVMKGHVIQYGILTGRFGS